MKKGFKVALVVGISIVAVAGAIVGKVYVVGNDAYYDNIYFDKVSVEDKKIKIHGGFVDSISACGKVKMEEKDGVVNVNINKVPTSFFSKNEIDIEKTFKNDVDKICVGETVIYENGVQIQKNVSELYENKTKYIGDHIKSFAVVGESGVYDVFDIGEKSLQTSKEPYGLMLEIKNGITSENEDEYQEYMKRFSAIFIGCIENLGVINWTYEINGESKEYSVTTEDASSLVGGNVKDISESVSKLQETIGELGLLELEVGKLN